LSARAVPQAVLDATLKAVVAAQGNVSVAARNLELPIGTVMARVKMLVRLKMLDLEALRNGPKNTDSPNKSATATESFEVSGDSAELFTSVPERVQSLDDLIRVCKVDTSEWEVERFICNKWEMGSKDAEGKATTTPLFQVKAWLKRRVVIIAARDEIAALMADAKTRLPKLASLAPRRKAGGYMLEIDVADLHNGKLAWGAETGHGNYDTGMAEQLHDRAVAALLERTSGYALDEVLIVLGNDLLHVDSRANMTTAGTVQDTDSRYYKVFLSTRRMAQRTIDRCRQRAKVRVVMVPGNHDRDSVWHLGDSLECAYHACPDVTIDNTPTQRKYVEFGKVMLMLTHGDKGKRQDYPLLMATEQAEMFGRTKYREAHTGHLHQTRVQEWHGVRVRILPSLAGTDAWHAENTYTGNLRAAEAFVWSKDEGLVATAFYNVPCEPLRESA
jgi:predicted phosphodiesterase